MAIDLKKLEQKFESLFNDPNFESELEQWLEARSISQNRNNAIVMRRFFVCGYCGNEVNAYGMECSSPDFDNNNAEIIEGACCVESIRYGSF